MSMKRATEQRAQRALLIREAAIVRAESTIAWPLQERINNREVGLHVPEPLQARKVPHLAGYELYTGEISDEDWPDYTMGPEHGA